LGSLIHADCPKGKKELDRYHKEQIIDYLKVYGDSGKTEISNAIGLGRKRLDRLLFELELDGMVDRKGSMQRPKWGCPLFGGKIARDNESRI